MLPVNAVHLHHMKCGQGLHATNKQHKLQAACLLCVTRGRQELEGRMAQLASQTSRQFVHDSQSNWGGWGETRCSQRLTSGTRQGRPSSHGATGTWPSNRLQPEGWRKGGGKPMGVSGRHHVGECAGLQVQRVWMACCMHCCLYCWAMQMRRGTHAPKRQQREATQPL
jgi:hypothetical protein